MKQWLYAFSTFAIATFTLSVSAKNLGETDSISTFQNTINFAEEAAYFVYNNTKLEIINENSGRTMDNYLSFSPADKIVLHFAYRLKLNTRSGVDNYGYILINKKQQAILNSFEVKTFKPGGEIIKFDSAQIFHSSILNFDNQKENIDLTKYVIPGVEVGDEIEVTYSLETTGDLAQMLFGNAFLNNNLPSIHSEYTIVIPYPYMLFYKSYNGFKAPKIENDDLKVINTFALDSTPAVKDMSYTCLYDQFPYFYYSVDYNKDQTGFLSWKDFYNQFVSFLYPSPYSDEPYLINYKKWIKRNLKDTKELTKFQKFEDIYNSIKNDFDIISPFENGNTGPVRPNLFKNKIERSYLYNFYAFALDYLDIDYYLCFGRNKYNGAIDESFLRKNEFTDYFLMYNDANHNSVFIYPHEINRKYNLNEIPSYLNETEVLFARNDTADRYVEDKKIQSVISDSQILKYKLKVSRNDTKLNYYHRLRTIGVDLDSAETKYNSIINFSGFSSTDLRHFYVDLLHNKAHYNLYLNEVQKGRDVFKLDSMYLINEKPNYPFKYSVGVTGKLGKFYNYMNDSTIVISVEEILNNNKIEYDKKNRNQNIVLPSAYSDIQDLVINFNAPIYIVNKDQLSKEFTNELGSYKFESLIIGEQSLRLISSYVIKKETIDKKAFMYLNDINDASNQMTNARIIIRIKKL